MPVLNGRSSPGRVDERDIHESPDFRQLPLAPSCTGRQSPGSSTGRQQTEEMPSFPNFQHVDEISQNSSTEFHQFQAGRSSVRLNGKSQQLREPGLRGAGLGRGAAPHFQEGGKGWLRRGFKTAHEAALSSGHRGALPATARTRPGGTAGLKHGFCWVRSMLITSKGTATSI